MKPAVNHPTRVLPRSCDAGNVWVVNKLDDPDGLHVFASQADAEDFFSACDDTKTQLTAQPILTGDHASVIINSQRGWA